MRASTQTVFLRPGAVEARPALPVALGLSVLALTLYAITCSPFVGSEDVAEFQALAGSHGIAHAGYPLYLLLLEALHRLPFLTAPWRANLASAIAAAVAVGLLAAIAVRSTQSRLAAATAGCAIALSYSLWHDATRAEIYTFTLALSGGALFAFLRYRETRSVDPLALCGLLAGLSLTAHLSALALAAVIAAALLADVVLGRAPLHHVVVAAAAVAVGLLPLLLIPLRDTPSHPMNYIAYTFDEHAARHIPWSPALAVRLERAALLLGAQYLEGGRFHPFQDALARLRLVGWNVVLNDLPGFGFLLALAGGVAAIVRRSALDVLLLAWLACLTFLFLYAADPMSAISFSLPVTWIAGLLLARGLALARARALPVALVLALAVVAAPWIRLRLEAPPAPLARTSAAAAWESWPLEWNPFSPDPGWEKFGRGVLAALPRRAHVLACWEEGTTLLALQKAVHLRPDVAIHLSCDSPGRIRAVIESARREAASVYATIPPRRLPAGGEWIAVASGPRGGLWRHREGRPGSGATPKPR
jgi:hypothetical protein